MSSQYTILFEKKKERVAGQAEEGESAGKSARSTAICPDLVYQENQTKCRTES
jgi:hypothetical protein